MSDNDNGGRGRPRGDRGPESRRGKRPNARCRRGNLVKRDAGWLLRELLAPAAFTVVVVL